ncbi:hypothetical protein SAY87_007851 [Trapa incisa]|uniref:Uncharacterized protein n=1 Tax=Trapa incisa TaxID=236973 RepID=A0AAN7KF27_9MYRT|nr:hypothetical protein SAY87_007851 [Trapa incisa]
MYLHFLARSYPSDQLISISRSSTEQNDLQESRSSTEQKQRLFHAFCELKHFILNVSPFSCSILPVRPTNFHISKQYRAKRSARISNLCLHVEDVLLGLNIKVNTFASQTPSSKR